MIKVKSFSEYCFETLALQKPFRWPEQLERSPVTDGDIYKAEEYFGYHFPKDFSEFLKSYILPVPTLIYGKFKGDWPGGGVTYSFELERYLGEDEMPEDLETCVLEFNLSGLEGMANVKNHSLEKNIERLSWTKTASFGYIFLGDFTDYLVFLECSTGEIVYIDHDFYTMSHQSEIDNLKKYKSILFKNFHDLLRCLFLGCVCDGETGELVSDEHSQI